MRVRLSDPEFLPDLLGILSVRPDCIATQVDDDAFEASLIGSHADGGALELTLMLQAWQAAHPEVTLELE